MEDQEIFEVIGALAVVAVIAYLIAVDANKKNRSGIAWGLFVFFTCLIAVPLYFLLTAQE